MAVIKNNEVVRANVQSKTTDPLQAEIQRLRAENEALKLAKTTSAGQATLKVSEKGAVSMYGMGRWPVTVYCFTKGSIEAGSPVFEGSQAHTLCVLAGAGDYRQSKVYIFAMANKATLIARQRASLAAKSAAADSEAL